jgi:hypothetical protein
VDDQKNPSVGFIIKNYYYPGTSYPNIQATLRDASGVASNTGFFIPTMNYKYFGYFKLQKVGTVYSFFVSDDEITWVDLGTTKSIELGTVCFFF